jgi:hypothetical protein
MYFQTNQSNAKKNNEALKNFIFIAREKLFFKKNFPICTNSDGAS